MQVQFPAAATVNEAARLRAVDCFLDGFPVGGFEVGEVECFGPLHAGDKD